jgi:lipopolysaccharide/colanic/teichoic acid biosynthesis glycosyltransferase
MAKRLFDWLASGVGLLLLAPLLLLMALAIKLDTPGPVFFRQTRVGRHGVEFRIHKFRTMRIASGAAVASAALQHRAGEPLDTTAQRSIEITVGDDPRITRVGAVLRRSKLDELAQLIDVWCGQMSLVGPRPEVPRYLAQVPQALRDKLLSVRPGITDAASLAFRDESQLLARAADPEREYLDVVLPAKLQLSARGIDEASFAGDLRLIAATLCALWGRSVGARAK